MTDSPFTDDEIEAGRKLFAAPVAFVKGVVDLSGLPRPDRAEVHRFLAEQRDAEMIDVQPTLVGIGIRAIGHRMFKEHPFEEAFFLPSARQFRAELSMPLMLLGGINRLDTMEMAMGEGFELVAMARALLREPDLPRRLQEGTATSGLCVHCNKCMPTTYTGTHCVLVH